MNKIKVFLITLVTLTLSISLAQAGQWQWEKLGERAVTHKITKGEINIGLGDGRYDALQLKVNGAAVNFKKVEVNYYIGKSEKLDIRKLINDGGRTEPLNLSGKARAIKSVEFWYETRSGKGARVTLWGRKA